MRLFGRILRHPVSAVGAAVSFAAVALFATLVLIGLFLAAENPYVGIITYLFVPAVFLLASPLVPLGLWLDRRGHAARGRRLPVVDLNQPSTRWRIFGFAVLTVVGIGSLAIATTKGVETVGTTEFCGETCHTIMEPEYTAFQRSPHASVDCVACHVAPGAGGFVESKLNGVSQAISAVLGTYHRPVAPPGRGIPSSDGTCLHCHTAEREIGGNLHVRTTFEEDEPNTRLSTVFTLHVGSGGWGGGARGIHTHADPNLSIRYRADPARETIWEVEVRRAGAEPVVYVPSGGAAPEGEAEWFEMGCNDCHNRIGHPFRTPESELDRALTEGRIASDLPYVKREGVRLLREGVEDGDFTSALKSFYAEAAPEILSTRAADLEAAGTALDRALRANVFPAMKVDWETYPDHIGHETFPGCFRCHNDDHAAPDGTTLSGDCELCHTVAAWQEEAPEVLSAFGGG